MKNTTEGQKDADENKTTGGETGSQNSEPTTAEGENRTVTENNSDGTRDHTKHQSYAEDKSEERHAQGETGSQNSETTTAEGENRTVTENNSDGTRDHTKHESDAEDKTEERHAQEHIGSHDERPEPIKDVRKDTTTPFEEAECKSNDFTEKSKLHEETNGKSIAKSDAKRTADRESKLSEEAVRYICVLLGIIVVLLTMIVFLLNKPGASAPNVEESLEILNGRIAELESNVKNNLSALSVLEQELKDFANKSSLVEINMQILIEKLYAELKANNTDFLIRVEELESFKSIFVKVFDEHKNILESIQTKMTEDLKDLKNKSTTLTETVDREMKNIDTKLHEQMEKLKKAKQEAGVLINAVKTDMERVEPHIFNKGALQTAFGLIIVLQFTLAFFVYNLYVKDGGMRRVKSSSGVLEQIPRNPTLEKTVCMICFKFDKSVEYNNLLTKVCDTTFRHFFVNRHEDLIEIPRCRLYVMFVEFSERHVIIEEPGLGLGSLKRCTHDAVAKLGGTLIIIYTRDPGSRNLSEDRRYNTNIYCVSHQPELISLRDDGRFFSIYDRFTQRQIDGLRDCIKQYVR